MTTPHRDHILGLVAKYRDLIEGGHFEEVDRELRKRPWEKTTGLDPHVAGSITTTTSDLFNKFHGAVANGDGEPALAILKRIRRSAHRLAV